MLRADLAMLSRRGDRLVLAPIERDRRRRAIDLAVALIDLVRSRQRSRAGRRDIREAARELPHRGSDRKLLLGLFDVLEDACTFADLPPERAEAIRRAVFVEAARVRRETSVLDRGAALERAARALSSSPDELDLELYADHPDEQRLVAVADIAPEELLERWARAREQAALLRATKVSLHLRRASPAVRRALFRHLALLELVVTIDPAADGSARIVIDGPLSMFGPTTRYGRALAQLLPILGAAESWRLEADVRSHRRARAATLVIGAGEDVEHTSAFARAPDSTPAALSEDLTAVISAFAKQPGGWTARIAGDVLSRAGKGVLVPDLELSHAERPGAIYLELVKSRETVWRRVELIKAGLAHPVVLAAPASARVSPEVLEAQDGGLLYVFRREPTAAAIVEHLERLAASQEPVRERPDRS